MDHRTIRPGHPDYPCLLKEIYDPPEQLFMSGNALGQAPAVAIVGTRRASRYGVEAAGWLAAGLAASGLTIVSGLARGIDAAAHRGALESGGITVAVLGCGLDVCYPPRNRSLYEQIAEKGCLVSEFKAGTKPLPRHFPVRNRIIAGMTMATVIVEARPKGGAMITARLAMEYGREVLALPGPVHSPGSAGAHDLIRDGARLVTSADDVLKDLGLLKLEVEGSSPSMTPDEIRVAACLKAEPALLDRIAREARMPASTIAAVLAGLEMKGVAGRYPGGRFAVSVEAGYKSSAG